MSAERLLSRDFETRSAVDLTRAGAWRYAADATSQVSAVKRHLPQDQEKKRADDAWLLREWKAWHQEELDAALAGPNGVLIAALVALLDRLELNAAATLLEFMQRHDWTSVSYAERLTVLHQIGQAMMRLRERNGLAPLDDPIPFLDQPDTAFRRIKQILLCAAPPGAHPGSHQMKHKRTR